MMYLLYLSVPYQAVEQLYYCLVIHVAPSPPPVIFGLSLYFIFHIICILFLLFRVSRRGVLTDSPLAVSSAPFLETTRFGRLKFCGTPWTPCGVAVVP